MIPAPLHSGSRIGIVATARKISIEELQPAVHILQSWGYEVVFSENLFQASNQFSGTDAQRAADFQQLLDDEYIDAILVARGGYGSVRMIDHIDFSIFTERPKWIIGYSDITVLHSHIHQLTGVPTAHATMPVNFPAQVNTGEALSTLRQLLSGETMQYSWNAHALNRAGEAQGLLTGGNLSVLYSLLGSVSFPDTDEKILFLEDLDEYLYHIDRMMMALKRAGALSNLAGLVVGGMSDMKDNTVPFGKTAEEIIADVVAEFNYPVCFGFPAGHITDNRALKLGINHQLSIGSVCTLQEH